MFDYLDLASIKDECARQLLVRLLNLLEDLTADLRVAQTENYRMRNARHTLLNLLSRTFLSALLGSALAVPSAYLAMTLSGNHVWLSIPLGTIVFVACLAGLRRAEALIPARRPLSPAPGAQSISKEHKNLC